MEVDGDENKPKGCRLIIDVTATCMERAIEEAQEQLDNFLKFETSHMSTCQVLHSSISYENELQISDPDDLSNMARWRKQCPSSE